jgi:RsiW-degrading membrane proteinase PrsW (M82 family)
MKLLVASALLPAFLLLWYVYRKDKIEKEPKKMIANLFVAGGLTIISAMVIEVIGMELLEMVFDPESVAYKLVSNIIIIAGAEEGGKYYILKKKTWDSPEFNYTYDAVVYAVAVSLGFAAFENVLYVVGGGFGVAILRGFTSVPGHAVDSVFMGCYYGLAKKASVNGQVSKEEGCRTKAIVIPVLLHGFYDFFLSMESGKYLAVFFGFYIITLIAAIRRVNKLSKNDAPFRAETGSGYYYTDEIM